VRHSALAAVDALTDIRHLTTHPTRPGWQEELGRPAVPSHSGDDEDVAARELDDADRHRPEDRASEKALAGTSDDDEIGIGGSRGLQDLVRWVAFPGDRAGVDGAGGARPRGDRVGFGEQPRGLPGSTSCSATMPSSCSFGSTVTTITWPRGSASRTSRATARRAESEPS
jgi:hypothetical protein